VKGNPLMADECARQHEPRPVLKLLDKWRLLQRAIADRQLSPTAKIVLAVLLECHNGETGRCDPSVDFIAARVDRGRRQVSEALGELIDAGYVLQQRRRGSSAYEFAAPLAGFAGSDSSGSAAATLPQNAGAQPQDAAADDVRKTAHLPPEERRNSAHLNPDDKRKTAHLSSDDVRKTAHLRPDDVRNSARLDVRKTAHLNPGIRNLEDSPPQPPLPGGSVGLPNGSSRGPPAPMFEAALAPYPAFRLMDHALARREWEALSELDRRWVAAAVPLYAEAAAREKRRPIDAHRWIARGRFRNFPQPRLPGESATVVVLDEDARWTRVKQRLRDVAGTEVFESWYEKLSLVAVDGAKVVLAVGNRFLRSEMQQDQHHARLKECWRQEVAQVRSIEIVVRAVDGPPAQGALLMAVKGGAQVQPKQREQTSRAQPRDRSSRGKR
jgi:hypothetical protein